MAGEQKKPKIDLKSRIPSKTVKGLTPAAGGAIPPPPGAVPAPPPDLLGRRTQPPKVSADPNDPLGAATVTGGPPAPAQPQIVVVQGEHHDDHVAGAASKKGVMYALIGAALVVGLGVGFLSGSATKGNEIKSRASNDAKDIAAKVVKTNENLQKMLDTMKAAQSELQNSAQLTQPTIDAIKGWSSGFSAADLKGREIGYFGEDVSGKLLTYANKVAHIDELRAAMTKGGALEAANAQIKAFEIPKDNAKWGVRISKQTDPKGAPMTMADLVDFGQPVKILDPASFTGDKEKKLKIKSGEVDVDPNPKDFFAKGLVSAIDGKDWLKACPVYAQARGYTAQAFSEIATAIEGSGDDAGTLKPGKDLETKLKSLAK